MCCPCLMQQFCYTNSWHSPITDPSTVIKSQSEASNLVQEDNTTIKPSFGEETVRVIAEPVCPPCEERFEKLSRGAKEFLQTDTIVSNGILHHNCSTSGTDESRFNSSGSVCRSPTLVDKLPQTFIHKTTDFHFHNLVGTPENVLFNPYFRTWVCSIVYYLKHLVCRILERGRPWCHLHLFLESDKMGPVVLMNSQDGIFCAGC